MASGDCPDWIINLFEILSSVRAELGDMKRSHLSGSGGRTTAEAQTTHPPEDSPVAAELQTEALRRLSVPSSDISELSVLEDAGVASLEEELSSRPYTRAKESGTSTNRAPIFHCSYDDLRSDEKPVFEEICGNKDAKQHGYAKLNITDLPPLSVDTTLIEKPGERHSTSGSYTRCGGFVEVKDLGATDIDLPLLPLPETEKKGWTREELVGVVENILQNPSDKPMPYIIGKPLFSDLEISAGARLNRRGGGNLDGINTPYMYWNVSGGSTITIFHKEDANLCSINVLRTGAPKVLVTIRPGFSQQFEARMRQSFKGAQRVEACDQFVRHLSCAVLPSQLKDWGLEYDLDIFGPGEGFLTLPGTYHMVVNLQNNLAFAINFEDASSPDMPESYKFCNKSRSCGGPHAITRAIWKVREEDEDRDSPRQKLPSAKPGETTTANVSRKRKAKDISTVGLPEPSKELTIEKLVDSVSNSRAICRFFNLVRSSRDYDAPTRDRFKLPGNGLEKAEALYNLNCSFRDKTNTSKFFRLLTDIRFAQMIDDMASDRGRMDKGEITNLLRKIGRETTEKARKMFHNDLREPRKWNRICSPFDGLQCFFPFESDGDISLRDYPMRAEDINNFHVLLGQQPSISKLIQVGKTFQDCVWGCEDFPEYRWESRTAKELSKLTRQSLIDLLEPVQFIDENMGATPDWPKPLHWPWNWPVLPDRDEGQCDLCGEMSCRCITSCFPSDFTPLACGRKGRGLFAGVPGRGTTVYKKGDALGQLVGEIVRPGTYKNGWALELRRSDIEGEPYVGQIYCRDKGNLFRLVNHACGDSASATVRPARITQRFRMVFYARRDLKDGDEITVDWGEDFLQGDCLCDACKK